MSNYAIISLGGKQYRVREGDRLVVDRIPQESGKTFHPQVLLVGGDGKPDLAPKIQVTARVVGQELGEKIRIGKYRRRTGYRRHTGFRAKLSAIEIESIGTSRATKKADTKPAADAKPATEAAPKGLPKGYADLTVAQIAEAAPGWRRPQLEAALEYEQAHAARKGALAALESALTEES
jgi:large subunit ribosomal protein L21